MKRGEAPSGQNERMSRQQRGGGGEVAHRRGILRVAGSGAHRHCSGGRDRLAPDRRSQRQRSRVGHVEKSDHVEHDAPPRPARPSIRASTRPRPWARFGFRRDQLDRPQRRRREWQGRRHVEGAQAQGIHESGRRHRLDRPPPDRQQRLLPRRPRRKGTTLATAVGPNAKLHLQFPSPAPEASAGHDCFVVVGASSRGARPAHGSGHIARY